ncbi:MAG: hypothetical protein JOZ73_10670 [Solirubrobacterales bacterium]|nr:hypothetical protein [Solirubrobacterales bacterium]
MRGLERASGTALARIALAGNPSDGYGGAVLATTFADFSAVAEARPGSALLVEPESALVSACVGRFSRQLESAAATTSVSWHTSVPQGLGLGGSSAISIATLRSLCELYGIVVGPLELAALATSVEREDLRIAGGREDQVVQAHQGLLFMDFGSARYERLDAALLPPMLIALRPGAAQPSGVAHAPLHAAFARGDAGVRAGIEELTSLAGEAREALLEHRHQVFASCVDRTFDVRARIMRLDTRQVAMVSEARELGLSANFTGSGGAIVCVCRDELHRAQALEVLSARGYTALAPRLGEGSDA